MQIQSLNSTADLARAEIMERYQMEWLQKGTHEKHLSVYEYEKKMRKAEVEELEQEISSQKDIIAD